MENNKLKVSIDSNKRNLFLFLLFLYPSICFAAAGFADRWNDFLFWMKPAIVFCLSAGLITFSLLLIIFFIFRKPIIALTDRLVFYLRKHNEECVWVIGLLWAVFLNFAVVGLNLTLWIVAVLPMIGLLLAFPVFLATGLRNKYLIGRVKILLLTAFFISAAVSILAFFYASNGGIINEPMALTTSTRAFVEGRLMHYPHDCLKFMCQGLTLFGIEVVLSFILVILGNIYRKLIPDHYRPGSQSLLSGRRS